MGQHKIKGASQGANYKSLQRHKSSKIFHTTVERIEKNYKDFVAKWRVKLGSELTIGKTTYTVMSDGSIRRKN